MSKFNFIYEDPSTYTTGQTPHGIYDNDSEFQNDSLTVCKYVARKLGHPVMQLEFGSGSMYACLEEAVSEYSTQINHYNTKNWMWEHYGSTDRVSGSGYSNNGSHSMGTGSHEPEAPHMGSTFLLSEQYGEAVNVGGGVTMYTGSITLKSSKQAQIEPLLNSNCITGCPSFFATYLAIFIDSDIKAASLS